MKTSDSKEITWERQSTLVTQGQIMEAVVMFMHGSTTRKPSTKVRISSFRQRCEIIGRRLGKRFGSVTR